MTLRPQLTTLGLMIFLLLFISACSSRPDSQSQCGTVSGFLDADREDGYYRAIVTHVQGKPVASQPNYQLIPGTYEFRFAELIHDPRLKVTLSARKTKVLKISIVAGQRYHFAAKFNRGKTYLGSDTSYWQPEIWLQDEFECIVLPKNDDS